MAQAFSAGKKIVKMIDAAKECTKEARELSSRSVSVIATTSSVVCDHVTYTWCMSLHDE